MRLKFKTYKGVARTRMLETKEEQREKRPTSHRSDKKLRAQTPCLTGTIVDVFHGIVNSMCPKQMIFLPNLLIP
jgi:hypothetical protein